MTDEDDPRSRLSAAEAENKELDAANKQHFDRAQQMYRELEPLRSRVADLERVLRNIDAQQAKTLAWLRSSGIVFDGPLGIDPKNWQHVGFSIYTDLCEMAENARVAVTEDRPALTTEEPTESAKEK